VKNGFASARLWTGNPSLFREGFQDGDWVDPEFVASLDAWGRDPASGAGRRSPSSPDRRSAVGRPIGAGARLFHVKQTGSPGSPSAFFVVGHGPGAAMTPTGLPIWFHRIKRDSVAQSVSRETVRAILLPADAALR